MPLRRSARISRASAIAGRVHRVAALPEATVARLPIYHRALSHLGDRGVTTVSSDELAEAVGVTPTKLRKDLSLLGAFGVRGVGYEVPTLRDDISAALGYARDWPVVICGVGHLGQALASYSGFGDRGVRIVGLVDADPTKVGSTFTIGDTTLDVSPISDLDRVVKSGNASIGVIATPATAAQHVCDQLIAAGIRSILNFAPTILSVPDEVTVRKVDLFCELQILAFHEQRRQGVSA